METVSQEKQILLHLQSGLSLTQYQAVTKFNCFRLASRIHRLRKAGYPIKTDMIELSNNKRIAKYSYDFPLN